MTRRLLPTLLAAVVLAACSGGQANKNIDFDSTDKNALVILGVTTGANPWRTSPYLVWSGWNPESRALLPDYKLVRHRADEDVLDFLNAANLFQSDSGGRNLFVFTMPPGTWTLEQVYGWSRHQAGYQFINGIYSPLYKDTFHYSILGSRSFAFTVGAGEVVYVGDLSVDADTGYVVRRAEDDIESARLRMTEYPEVADEPIYRPLVESSFICSGRVRVGPAALCKPKADEALP